MKLRRILNEIGQIVSPPGMKLSRTSVMFTYDGEKYVIHFKIVLKMQNRIALKIEYATSSGGFNLTNQNQPLKIFSYIFGGIEEWIKKYQNNKEIVYISYNPKSEDGETPEKDVINRRDKIYRLYIKKLADQYDTEVNFQIGGNVFARFNPPLTIT